MQPHSSPRVRSLGAATVVLAVVVAMLLVPCLAMAANVGCDPGGGGDSSWVLQTAQVAQPAGNVGALVTDGCSAYWADDHSGSFDIYAVDLSSGTVSTVVGGDGNQYDPAACNGFLAYVDDSSGSPMIWGLDTSSGDGPFAISSASGVHPATDGKYVVWSTSNADGADIMGYDIGSGQEFTVCDAPGAQVNPAVSDGVVVWQDDRNGTWDIYSATIDPCDDSVGPATPVCTADGDQTNPDIYCGFCVWQDDRNGDSDIYGAYLPGDEPPCGGSVGGQLVRSRLGCHPDGAFAICTADGDQTDPSVAGPLVAWTDARNGAGDSDIYGYNLEDKTAFAVCTADGAQTHPDVADNGTIVWLDSRSTEVPAVWQATWVPGGDTDNPVPTSEWTSNDLITMFLSVFNQMGIFSDFRVSFDGGANWSDWQPFADVDQLQLPCGDGAKSISLQFEDADGNQTPVITVTVYLDTHGPTTVTPDPASARAGKAAVIRFKVRDALSPKATVTLRVRNRHGKLVKVVKLGARSTNRLQSARFACNLRRGTYRFSVLARDLAGNPQVKIGANRLVVR